MEDTSTTMEVKAETKIEIDKIDIQNGASERAPNQGTEMEIPSAGAKVENIATQETVANIMEHINIAVEPVKDKMETSLDDILEELPGIDKGSEFNDKKQRMSEESIELNNVQLNEGLQNTPETALELTVTETEELQDTKVTDDESQCSPQSVNPLKRRRCLPLKRKRMPKINRVMTDKVAEVVTESDLSEDTSMEEGKEDVEYCLTVSNLPNSWNFMDIKNYIDTECGPVDEIEMIKDDKTSNGAIRLSYQTEDECMVAKEKLIDKEIAGNKLILEITVESFESGPEAQSETTDTNKPWKPDMDSWELDLHGMYGLKLQYLRALGITPPLDKWVHVSNFRCDKSELRDVMEMAGNVQMCSVFSANQRYANVMYSHPLEAVQAVAMLNNQLFYGQPLKVAMDRSPLNTVLLPKGLTNIGQGLGLNGKPLKNIVKHYERFIDNKDCLINPVIFDVPANHVMKLSGVLDAVKFKVKSVEEFNYPIAETKCAFSKAVTTKAVTPVQSVVAPKPVLQSPKPAVVQSPPYTLPPPKPVPAPPPRANFTPSFQRPFPTNIRPFVGPAVNGQRAAVPMGPHVMPPGPCRPTHSGIAGPLRPPHPGLAGPPRPPHPGLAGPLRPPHTGPVGPPRPPHPGVVGPPRPPHPGVVGPPRPPHPGVVGSPRPPQYVRPFPGTQAAWGPGPRPMLPGPRPGPMFPNEPVKLILSNLPPSTSFALLCEKMSEWGQVVCIQLTTPGCAVVTFANRMQADACFKHFNGRNIENYLVHVKYA